VDCIFCRIAAGTAPAFVLYADDDAVAFLDIAPTRRGHTLVIPREHVPDLTAPGADTAVAAVGRALHCVSKLLVEALDADGVSLFQSNGAAAGQEVFHLHAHLVPRHVGDGGMTVWQRDPAEAERLEMTYRALAGAT
jgi:histidine triad (HIT) family protein